MCVYYRRDCGLPFKYLFVIQRKKVVINSFFLRRAHYGLSFLYNCSIGKTMKCQFEI